MIKKYHGLGNDYLVIDPSKVDVELQETHIRKLCKRNYGVGADGILYGPIMKGNEIHVRCFNPDASEATNTGTGIRIFAKYLKDEGYTNDKCVCFYTASGKTEVEFLNEDGTQVRAKIGKPNFCSKYIPVIGQEREVINEVMYFAGQPYEVTCLSVGNPHCVLLSDEVSYKQVMEIGPAVESAEYFPERINFMALHVVDRTHVEIEVYERGAGYTLASGTSACAAAATTVRLGLTERHVEVKQPGGTLDIELNENDEIIMTGSAEEVGLMMVNDAFFA
ncbi:MAG: diaminopimelate epimerase [Lachnospiraceae bacterium]|nr:diaminopimelate epimerase [Lachnospiraceae bacterium]